MPKALTAADLVEDAAKLINIFGSWPSFHDAEVVRINLERAGSPRSHPGTKLEIDVHLWETTADIGPDGKTFVCRKHTLATFIFTEVSDVEFEGFNHQNVLWDLEISEIESAVNEDRRINVELSSSFGVSGEFKCKKAFILKAEPFAHAA